MNSVLIAFFAVLASSFRTSVSLRAEILALRHQLAVLQANAPRRLRLKSFCTVTVRLLAEQMIISSSRHRQLNAKWQAGVAELGNL
jgi:hypothetical protein